MLKIMIVDNNVLFREGLSNLLLRESGIQVVAEAGSIYEASEKMKNTQVDLALVDGDLPDIDAFRGIRRLLVQSPRTQIVLLSVRESEEIMVQGVRQGARGFLPKTNSIARFMAAIRAIERGEAVIPRAMVGRLLDEFMHLSTPVEQEGLGMLTPREIEVLAELSQGCSNRQIANNLEIAENTVKVHVHNILEKLNLRNRRQAARYGRIEHGNGIATQKRYVIQTQ